jgi:N-methylhydantoinase A
MFSFLDSAHESAVLRQVEQHLPDLHVSASGDVLPQVGFYERVSTTTVNAFVSPLLGRYLDALAAGLLENGFRGSLLIMQSNGGVCAPEVGKRFGVRAVLSGPAAAPVAAAHIGALYGLKNAISVDMGGTSFDVCLINDGRPHVTSEGELAGYRIALPMVAIHTIGAGGGSIVGVDTRKLLSVGPQSAGAYPGAVSYGRGGTEPTVTDANLLLGYLDPHTFWGGRLTLDLEAASRAFQERVAEPLGLDLLQAAFGSYRVVNEGMVDAIREVSVRRGHDPRHYALVAAGGAGPLHVGALAAELDIPLVIVPRLASVFCALGGLLSDLRHDFVTSFVTELAVLDLDRANAVLERLFVQGQSTLRSEGVSASDIDLQAFVELRYIGQFDEVEVPLVASRFSRHNLDALIGEFHRRHEAVNGWQDPSHLLEMVSIGVVAVGRTAKPRLPALAATGSANGAALAGERRIYWNDRNHTVRVYRGLALEPHSLVRGPALVEQETTTVLVPPDFDWLTDEFGNGLMYRHGANLQDILSSLREAR